MKTVLKLVLKLMLVGILLFSARGVKAQDPTYTATIMNDEMISSSIYEFDLYLTRTGSVALEMANFQAAITIDPAFRNGGTITPVIVSGSSELNIAQSPSSIAFTAAQNCIKIAPKLPPRTLFPGSGTSSTSGTIISTTGNKVCRIRLTNSVPFGNSSLSPVWSFTIDPYRTVVSAFIGPASLKVNTPITLASSHSKSLNLKFLTEGLYNTASGQLSKVQDADVDGNTWDKYPGLTADMVKIQLAAITSPWDVVYTAEGIRLNSNGSCRVPIPGALNGTYYIIVNHRNSVETWSKSGGESFAANTTSFDFTTSLSQAYNSNQVAVSGSVYAIYSGDFTSSVTGVKDEYIDITDLNEIYNLSNSSAYSYQPADLTGDGFVAIEDLNLVYNNNKNAVGMNTPPNPAKKK